jgi:sarcosine oxidase subunit alpha
MHDLRAEKGFIIVGQDTDGTVTPDDAGYGRMVATTKPDFVGKRGLKRPDLVASGRRQIVGLSTTDPHIVLEVGAQIVADPNQVVPMRMIGHVTSAYFSESLGRSIALALIENGRALTETRIHIPMPGVTHTATITSPVFVDPEGARLNV